VNVDDAIEIEVCYRGGDEESGLYAKGHHDTAAFCAAAVSFLDKMKWDAALAPAPDVDIGYEWWRDEPSDNGDVSVWFRAAKPGEPGAYEVTCYAFEGGVLVPRAGDGAKDKEGAP
jgi:hypothetical protein